MNNRLSNYAGIIIFKTQACLFWENQACRLTYMFFRGLYSRITPCARQEYKLPGLVCLGCAPACEPLVAHKLECLVLYIHNLLARQC